MKRQRIAAVLYGLAQSRATITSSNEAVLVVVCASSFAVDVDLVMTTMTTMTTKVAENERCEKMSRSTPERFSSNVGVLAGQDGA